MVVVRCLCHCKGTNFLANHNSYSFKKYLIAEVGDIKVVRKYGGDWMFPRWELAVCSEQSGSPHGAQNEKY